MSKQTTRWRYAQHELSADGVVPCHYCSTPLTIDTSTVDHKLPSSLGGRNTSTNFLLCCRLCNLARGNMSYDEFKIRWPELRSARLAESVKRNERRVAKEQRRKERDAIRPSGVRFARDPDENPDWTAPCFPTKGPHGQT